MELQKLPWAGMRVTSGSSAVVIDPLYHFPDAFGRSRVELFPLSEYGPVDAVLITHHHYDHFDPEAIRSFYGADIPVFLPAESVKLAEEAGLTNVRGASAGQSHRVGALTATAVPSVDGVGDVQIAWIVEGGGRKMIHCGDTLWHGYWWRIADDYGPFDAACLPVNGAVIETPGSRPSGQPISLTPEQAVAAAFVLDAKQLVPIHYAAVHHPPAYRETPDVMGRLTVAAHDRMKLSVLQTKETLTL